MTLLRSAVACALAIPLLVPAGRLAAQPYPPEDDSGYAAASSPGGVAPDPGEYEQSLAPYGRWMDAPPYGRVWAPAPGARVPGRASPPLPPAPARRGGGGRARAGSALRPPPARHDRAVGPGAPPAHGAR